MTMRTSAACAIRISDSLRDGDERVWYVGPFMPHQGSACDAALSRLYHERSEQIVAREMTVETLFLATGESDLIEPRP